MKKTIAITGAGGFIGKNLCIYFLNKGFKVYGIDIYWKNMLDLEKYENFQMIKNIEDIYEVVDIFYHIAWGGSLLSIDLDNVDLQMDNVKMSYHYVSEMIKKNCKKVVFCGSSYQYMYFNNTKIKANIYGIAKSMTADIITKICEENHIKYNIAILTNTFGVGDKSKKAVNTFITTMLEEKELILVEGRNKNDWMYIDDTIEGLASIGINGINKKQYYVGHTEIRTFKDMLEDLKVILNYKKELIFGGYPEKTYIDYSNLNAKELFQDTGFISKTNFDLAIKQTSNWLITYKRSNKNE